MALIFIGVVLVVYLPALRGQFLFDDWFILHQPFIQLGDWRTALKSPLRPIVWLMHVLERRLCFGEWKEVSKRAFPAVVHIVNVLLHGVNVWLVYEIFGKSILGALVFAVHPFASSAVAYCSARPVILSATFSLLSVLLLNGGHPYWALGGIPLAILSKEDAVILPVMLAALNPGMAWLYLGGAMIVGIWKCRLVMNALNPRQVGSQGWEDNGVVPLKGWEYRKAWLVEHVSRLPLWLVGIVNPDPDVRGPAAWKVPLAIIALIPVLAVLVWWFSPLAFAFLFLTPMSLYYLVETPDVVFEYRGYLATVGFAAVWLRIFSAAPGWFVGLMLFAFAGITFCNSWYWSSPIGFWSWITRMSPRKMRGWINLSLHYRDLQNWTNSQYCAQKAHEVQPSSVMPFEHMAWLADREGRYADAREFLRKGVELCPRAFLCWFSLGQLERILKNDQAALCCYREAVRLNPKYDPAWFELGKLTLGQPESASMFRRAVKIRPDINGYQEMLAVACHLTGEDPGPECNFRVTDEEPIYATVQ